MKGDFRSAFSVRGRMVSAAVALVAAAGCALPLQAQQADWTSVLNAARKEGRVTVYVQTLPAVNARLGGDFKQAQPDITPEILRIVGLPLLAKVEEEHKIGSDGADVVIVAEPVWLDNLAKAGRLKAPAGPASRDWPARYLVGGAAPLLALEPFALAYNTNIVKTPVTGYQDLLRPEFKGKVAILEPVAGLNVAWYDWLTQTQGADFLAKLAAQQPKIYTGTPPPTQATAAGEMSVTSFTVPSTAMPLIASGAPIRMVVPTPSLGYSLTGAILASSKRPNAAQVFMDYLMSTRGQTTWHGKGESASPLAGIPGAIDGKSVQLYDSVKYTVDAVKPFLPRFDAMFRK